MATEDENVAILQEAYWRWAEGKGKDLDGWTAIMDEAISLRSIGQGGAGVEFSSPRTGRSGVLDYLERLTRDWDMLSYEMDEFVAQGDRVVAIGRCAWRNKRTGKVADTRKVDLWRFKDGRVIEFEELFDTAAAMAAAQP